MNVQHNVRQLHWNYKVGKSICKFLSMSSDSIQTQPVDVNTANIFMEGKKDKKKKNRKQQTVKKEFQKLLLVSFPSKVTLAKIKNKTLFMIDDDHENQTFYISFLNLIFIMTKYFVVWFPFI